MNPKHQFEDWVYEKLYESIMKAISRSPEVRDVMKNLESRGLTRKMAAVNLILCMNELAELTRGPLEETGSAKNPDVWDSAENFDEARWMKQARIKL